MESRNGNDGVHHKKLSYDIVGCAMRVHSALGPGFPESVYHKALSYELTEAKIPFESEKALAVSYRGRPCGEFRTDLVVDEQVILELKALERLSDDHMAQAISYLKASKLKLAILINFGTKSLQTQRVVL